MVSNVAFQVPFNPCNLSGQVFFAIPSLENSRRCTTEQPKETAWYHFRIRASIAATKTDAAELVKDQSD